MKYEAYVMRGLRTVGKRTVDAEDVYDAIFDASMDIMRGQVVVLKLDGVEVGGVDYDAYDEPTGWVVDDDD